MSWSPFGENPHRWMTLAVALILTSVGLVELVVGILLIRGVEYLNVIGCLAGVVMCAFGVFVGFLGAAMLYYTARDWRRP